MAIKAILNQFVTEHPHFYLYPDILRESYWESSEIVDTIGKDVDIDRAARTAITELESLGYKIEISSPSASSRTYKIFMNGSFWKIDGDEGLLKFTKRAAR